ncbi:MAG: hypothetical protein AAF740_00620 [Bacteroidota bacterium]
MKHLALVTLLSAIFCFSSTSLAQCDAQKYTDLALADLPKDFNLVKTFRIDGKGGDRKRMEHSLILNSSTDYVIRLSSADGGSKGIIATLYDARHNKITSTKTDNGFLKGLTYSCNLAGRYYLVLSFEGSQKYCGAAVLGFKPNISN